MPRDRLVTTAAGAQLAYGDDTVVKWHRPGTSISLLQARLDAIAAAPFVQPLGPAVTEDNRVVTRWPLVELASPEDPPWQAAGALLTQLHSVTTLAGVSARTLPLTWPDRVARAADRAEESLRALGRHLARQAAAHRPVRTCLIHGDWHLGQLGRVGDTWLLLDPDDVAVGDPWWDVARPAGFWAAGLMPDADWAAFLAGYRPAASPWPDADLPARCAVYIAAVRAQIHREPTADALIGACHRMAQ